ncbi:hypothetical protein GQ55_7G309500 [Panicum hallii var. hallii]|uniref:Uncharacterized protein n=1 Tax=Panicum hallii var. hallii TaxID=1504633 RepID=A0A2T7D0U7_9POAL|nr:hypothetical protein GQ55_7G309500 [Panicum hallii var. hallii]
MSGRSWTLDGDEPIIPSFSFPTPGFTAPEQSGSDENGQRMASCITFSESFVRARCGKSLVISCYCSGGTCLCYL